MSFFKLRELFVGISFLAFLAIPRTISSLEMSYWATMLLLNGVPILLLLIHHWTNKKYRQDFDNYAYFNAIFCITALTTFGSFSKKELIEFGFHFLITEPVWVYFSLKSSFFFWSLVLLPVVLQKFFKKD